MSLRERRSVKDSRAVSIRACTLICNAVSLRTAEAGVLLFLRAFRRLEDTLLPSGSPASFSAFLSSSSAAAVRSSDEKPRWVVRERAKVRSCGGIM